MNRIIIIILLYDEKIFEIRINILNSFKKKKNSIEKKKLSRDKTLSIEKTILRSAKKTSFKTKNQKKNWWKILSRKKILNHLKKRRNWPSQEEKNALPTKKSHSFQKKKKHNPLTWGRISTLSREKNFFIQKKLDTLKRKEKKNSTLKTKKKDPMKKGNATCSLFFKLNCHYKQKQTPVRK